MRLNIFKKTPAKYVLLTSLALIVLGLIIVNQLIEEKPQIKEVQPAANSTLEKLETPILVTLHKQLTSEQQDKVSIQITPSIQLLKKWLDQQTLKAAPINYFKEGTEYKIDVYYNQNIVYQWSFKTAKPTLDDPAGEVLQKNLKEKPWIANMPIKTNNYKIQYLGSKDQFRVLMKIDITSPLSRNEQIEKIKTEAPQKLEEIGIDTSAYKIEYTFNP